MSFFNGTSMSRLFVLACISMVLILAEHHDNENTAAVDTTATVTCLYSTVAEEFKIGLSFNGKPICVISDSTLKCRKGTKFEAKADQDGMKVKLHISNVTFDDAGQYKCLRILKGDTADPFYVTLNVRGDVTLMANDGIKEGERLSVQCCVKSTEVLNWTDFSWFWDNGSEISVDRFGSVIDFGNSSKYCENVTLNATRHLHGKSLGCLIAARLNSSTTKPLNVNYPASVHLMPMVNTSFFGLDESNHFATIACRCDGHPPPTVELQIKNGGSIWVTMNDTLEDVNDNTWTFSYNITNQGQSVIKCVARNGIDEPAESDVITITSIGPPYVTMISVTEVCRNDIHDAYILCKGEGDPTRDIHLQRFTDEFGWEKIRMEKSDMERTENESGIFWKFHILEDYSLEDIQYRCVSYGSESEVSFTSNVTLSSQCTEKTIATVSKSWILIFGFLEFLLLLMIITILLMKRGKCTRCYLHGETKRSRRRQELYYQNVRDIPDLCYIGNVPVPLPQTDEQSVQSPLEIHKREEHDNSPINSEVNADCNMSSPEGETLYSELNQRR